jgi:hypothetical protein
MASEERVRIGDLTAWLIRFLAFGACFQIHQWLSLSVWISESRGVTLLLEHGIKAAAIMLCFRYPTSYQHS